MSKHIFIRLYFFIIHEKAKLKIMKLRLLFALVPVALFMTSCESDQCTQTISYTKATAIYQNLDDTRNVELWSPAKEISDPGKIYVADNYLLIGEEGA